MKIPECDEEEGLAEGLRKIKQLRFLANDEQSYATRCNEILDYLGLER